MPTTFCDAGFWDMGFTHVGCSDVDGSDRSASTGFMKRALRRTWVVGIGGFSFIVAAVAAGSTLAICSTKLLKTPAQVMCLGIQHQNRAMPYVSFLP
jgi:hypothetical protein